MERDGAQLAGETAVRHAASPRSEPAAPTLRRALVTVALVVLGLSTVVAVVLARSAPAGDGPGGAPVDLARIVAAIERGMLTVGVLAAVAVAVGFVWVIVRGGAVPRDRSTRQQLRAAAAFVLMLYLVTVVLGIVLPRLHSAAVPADFDAGVLDDAAADASDGGPTWPVVILLFASVVSLVAWWRLRDRVHPPSEAVDDVAREVLVAAVARTDDGVAVDDVVIAAYARLQQAFADIGYPRAAAETTGAYVDRVLRHRLSDPDALVALTAVYERVRFGTGGSTATDRRDAVTALRRTLDGLHRG